MISRRNILKLFAAFPVVPELARTAEATEKTTSDRAGKCLAFDSGGSSVISATEIMERNAFVRAYEKQVAEEFARRIDRQIVSALRLEL